MDLKHIPLEHLKVSRLNMRHGRKAPDIADLLPSIRESGVRQSLLVRKEGKQYGVIVGRRRYFALKQVAKETGKPIKAPCGILQSGKDAEALEASLLENVARLPAGEFEQYDAFAKLVAEGKSPEDIAQTFGVTDLKVRRILSLARVNTEIKALYEAEDIGIATLHALTLASDDQQKQWLDLFNGDDYAPLGPQLKAWLTGGVRIRTDAALFDVSTYKGAILTDLFEENAVFQEPDLFWNQQNAVIESRKAFYLADGWANVVHLERGTYFYSWDYRATPRDEGGKVFVECQHDGCVTFHEGYLTEKEARKIDAGAGDSPTANIKPELSKPMADYVAHHRQAMVRANLLGQGGLVLRLIAAHLIVGSPLWQAQPQSRARLKPETRASLESAPSETQFEDAKARAIALAGFDAKRANLIRQNGDDWALAKLFMHLQTLDDKDVMDILTVAMGETLTAGSMIVDAIAAVSPKDDPMDWTQDDTFFDLLRDKRVINAMLSDIAGEASAKAAEKQTGKAQKEAIRNHITGKGGLKAQPDWTPRWMRFPAMSYLSNDGCQPAINASKVAALTEQPSQGSSRLE